MNSKDSPPPEISKSWYDHCREDCQTIIQDGKDAVTEFAYQVQRTLIETYHNLGHRINRELEAGRKEIYGQSVVAKLSKDIGRSETTLYYAVEFVKRFPSLDDVTEISWSKVKKLLAEPQKECNHDFIEVIYNVCAKCGQKKDD